MDVAYEEEDSGLESFDRMERRQMKTPRMNSNREEYESRDNRIGDGNVLFTDRSLNREYLDMVNEEEYTPGIQEFMPQILGAQQDNGPTNNMATFFHAGETH